MNGFTSLKTTVIRELEKRQDYSNDRFCRRKNSCGGKFHQQQPGEKDFQEKNEFLCRAFFCCSINNNTVK